MLSEKLMNEWSKQNTLDPANLSPMSNKKAFWKCDHGHEWIAAISDRSRGTGCPYCGNRKVLKGFNDLAFRYPDIAAEWSRENDRQADEVVFGSTYNAIWKCDHGHEWKMSVVKRTQRGLSCPYCSGQKLLKGFNDLETTRPDLAAQWSNRNEKSASEYMSGSSYKAWWKCDHGHEWKASICSRNFYNSECPECVSKRFSSKPEQGLLKFIKESEPSVSVIANTRQVIYPYELDIYIPSLNIAFEFNGLYWHSEQAGKDRNYHYDKWLACKNAGIQLITIWEDDWRDKQGVVKSMILHKLGESGDVRTPARKTVFEPVDSETSRIFLNAHHIQGYRSMCANFGLFAVPSHELVAVMSLSKSNRELTIERYATSRIVQGGFTKMMKHAIDEKRYKGEIDSIITFSDNAVSDGGLYERYGFVKDLDLKPDYSYVHHERRQHKFLFRKSRFKNDDALVFEEGKTEFELAKMNGLNRIWDCGKVRWRKVL